MYTFWKRSAPPASMEIFNAPTRESCTVRRERTNTPLQALVTMNDVQFVEAARVLAERSDAIDGDFDARLDYIATRVLARPLTLAEKQRGAEGAGRLRRTTTPHPEDAREAAEQAASASAIPSLPAAELAA